MKILMIVYDNDSFIANFPVGLAYLAAAARNAGHEVKIYQQDIYHWPESHLTDTLDRGDYDIVMVSVIGGYYQYRKIQKISKAINTSKRRTNMTYLIGGHGPASDPEFYLKKTEADIVGIGEGEVTIVELLDAIENNKPLSNVDGIAFFNDLGQYIRTNPRALIEDIDEIALPAYDLFEMNFYVMNRFPNIKATQRSMSILSGRGCTFECNFCYRLDKGFRPRSADSILNEIKYLHENYNVTYIGFFDELLMSSKQRTQELCQAFIESNLEFSWDCNGRLNYADRETLTLMKKAGCVFINYGIESLDDATLKVMNKALTKDIIVKGIENTLEIGISPGLNIIYGNIDEPLEAIDMAVEFLLKYDDHSQMRTIRPVTPYPGSPLFDYAVEHNLIANTEDFYENKHLNSDLLACNFTQHDDDVIYKKLYDANIKLINKYYETMQLKSVKICEDLYMNKNTNFRGFRHT